MLIRQETVLKEKVKTKKTDSWGFGVLGFWGFGVLVEISLFPVPCSLFPVPCSLITDN
jgi:hypothetical protein